MILLHYFSFLQISFILALVVNPLSSLFFLFFFFLLFFCLFFFVVVVFLSPISVLL